VQPSGQQCLEVVTAIIAGIHRLEDSNIAITIVGSTIAIAT